jgi:hypothetical protein
MPHFYQMLLNLGCLIGPEVDHEVEVEDNDGQLLILLLLKKLPENCLQKRHLLYR